MSKVAIMTDSNSGITQAQAKDLGVFVVPMPFYIDGQLYYEDIEISGNNGWDYVGLMTCYTFSDGTPFGVKEE